MKWTTEPPTQSGWYWFHSEALNRAPRVVHVIETLGEFMVDDAEFGLYEEVRQFPDAHWSDRPMAHPDASNAGWTPLNISDVEW